ncbi:MAG: DUF6434 domain-containing protein [Bacteroidota bacterium]
MPQTRPDFPLISSGSEFNQWYWLKEEMVDILKAIGLPYTGGKFELRDRIMYALDHEGALKPTEKKPRPQSNFNWAREQLTLETIITDNVSFGPNFRRFMKAQIGAKFSCHSDFMAWMKENPGKTLENAVDAWKDLEARKKDPTFKRDIADHNMLAQYVRDFLADQSDKQLKDALHFWNLKRKLPMENGFVRYAADDLDLT